jgi:hypothetical protein
MLFGVPGLKKTLSAFSVLIVLCLILASCSGSGSTSQRGRSGLKFRAFVSNPLLPTGTGTIQPVLEIVDASKDLLSGFTVSLLGALPDAGMMALSPNKSRTVVFSPSNNALAVVDNALESLAANVSTIILPGSTESMFVAGDNTTGFVAVPTAPVSGQASGVVERINISTGGITATIPIPGAHFLVPSPSGNQILAFSDTPQNVCALNPSLAQNLECVAMIAPSLISSGSPITVIQDPAFDHPVWGVFNSSGSTAFIMNCGPECGGVAASVSILDMSQSPPVVSATVPVPAATFGLLSGNNLFVAGTPSAPLNDCAGVTTSATSCGRLTVIDTSSFAVTNSSPIPIADGYHNRMQMGANGQLFIGANNCTNINVTGGEVRGCLSIVNTSSQNVIVSAENGDVTGIEPVSNRNVVYVCEGGRLTIYDTTTDQPQKTQVSIIGQAIDVKIVDF